MLDNKIIREDVTKVIQLLKKKKFNFDLITFKKLESKRKILQTETQELQRQKNISAKKIGIAKQNNKDIQPLLKDVENLKQKLQNNEQKLNKLLNKLHDFLSSIPNIPADDVPTGDDESANVVIKKYGAIPKFEFKIKDHQTIATEHNMDFATAAKITKSRFVILKNDIAKLQRSLITFMLEHHTKNNYTEVYVPFIVNQKSLYGTGQLPKFKEDSFKIEVDKSEDFYLIPTAEVPVTNIYSNSILKEELLPIKMVSHTPCFRSEAGAYGKDTSGIIRQHQFEKVELVQIVHPNKSDTALVEITKDATDILEMLELPYRVVNLCGGDLGFSSHKTYDIEVWMPAQNTYREISSCSSFANFQARRMSTRFKDKNNNKQFVHTLNGSALAVGRTLAAILENFQQQDGSVKIPQVLQKYFQNDRIYPHSPPKPST
jgi:seryl-tRNA synthetase